MNNVVAKNRIGELLTEKGYITHEQLEEGLREQSLTGKRLGNILAEQGHITEDQLLETVSERLKIPKLSLDSMVIDPKIIKFVPVDVARRYTLVPIFKLGKTLTLAMSDPLNVVAIDEIRYITGLNIKRAIASDSDIRSAIDEHYSVEDSLHLIIGTTDSDSSTTATKIVKDQGEAKSAVAQLVELMIDKAVKERASDIHVEPEESRLRIRYRIDGHMLEEAAPPKDMQNEIISRIKVAANLDVSEKRLPQDGRFMVTVDGANIDLRISTLPTIHGEKIVIRILDRRNLLMNFQQLGFSKSIAASWSNIIQKPEGLILISGPTSSGKTSTLYATLNEINSVEKNIITVEDPVEYSIPLIIQVQINERAGLTYPSTLRAILRQNPDTIMIGEIRDAETASMAIRSALTGHLVFSTIHTNDALSTVSRLIDMGIEPYLVGTALKGVLAQRLVRVNCPECSEVYRPSDPVLERAGLVDLADEFHFRRGTGCPKCRNTGFKGLTGIYEYFEIDPVMADLIMRRASLPDIHRKAMQSGYMPLFEMGLGKLQTGKVSLEELLKETSNTENYSQLEETVTVRMVDANPV